MPPSAKCAKRPRILRPRSERMWRGGSRASPTRSTGSRSTSPISIKLARANAPPPLTAHRASRRTAERMSLDAYGRFLLALILVVALILAVAWLARRFGLGGRFVAAGGARRQI